MKKCGAIFLSMVLIFGLVIGVTTSWAKGPYEDTSAWKIEASSNYPSMPIEKAFDGNVSTIWHTYYKAEGSTIVEKDQCPYTITVTFPEALEISAVRYIPRQKTATNGSSAGIFKTAEIYGSADGKTFEKLVTANFDVVASREAADVTIPQAKYKAIRIVVTASESGYGTAAEIQMINPNGSAEDKTPVETAASEAKEKTQPAEAKSTAAPSDSESPGAFKVTNVEVVNPPQDDAYGYEAGWDITVSSALSERYAARMFDGDVMTYWHSWYKTQDGKITFRDSAPYTITVVFPEKKLVSGLRYTPRQISGNDRSTSGIVLGGEVYVSDDGENFSKIALANFSYASGYADRETQTVSFDTVEAKAVRFVITEGVSGWGTCAELEILKGKGEAKEIAKLQETMNGNRKVITMQIDSTAGTVFGNEVTLAKAPVIVDGRTLVPIRFVSENLGAVVSWDGDSRTVTIMDGTNVISLAIDSDQAEVNGKTVTLDVPARIMDGSTMVPIRFVSENLGADVSWDGGSRTVTIATDITIACWGDSLTAGDGATNAPYPRVLSKMSGAEVYNLGIGGETALTIAARQGAYDIVFTEDFVIPASGSVELPLATIGGSTYLSTSGGGQVFPRQVSGKWNPAYINGVAGMLALDVDTSSTPRKLRSVTFTRTKDGAPVEVKKGDKLITSASFVKADINVIYIGCNGLWNEDNTGAVNTKEQADKLVEMIWKMVDNTKDPEKFIVVGFTFGKKDDWSVVDRAMQEAFGDHYVATKPYLASEEALSAAGVTPTEADKSDLAIGRVPESLRKSASDTTHLNDKGYTLLANLIYRRMVELGYFSE